MPQITASAIAPQLEDELTRASIELATHLEDGHLNFQLYDDELVTKITHSAEQEQITNQQAIAIAFRRSEKLSQLQQEHQEAIAEVRERQIEMQRELIKKDERIEDLEKLLASTSSTALPTVETLTVPCTDNITWEDVAQSVNCDRSHSIPRCHENMDSAAKRNTSRLACGVCGNELSRVPRPNWLGARQVAGCRT